MICIVSDSYNNAQMYSKRLEEPSKIVTKAEDLYGIDRGSELHVVQPFYQVKDQEKVKIAALVREMKIINVRD